MSIQDYTYKGKHRPQSRTERVVSSTARLAAVAALAVGGAVLSTGTASAADDNALLDSIAQCESSGNSQASNGSHFGLYQFDSSTWASVGGSGSPLNASPAEQTKRAQMLLAQRGTQPWLASQHCWGGSSAPVKAQKKASVASTQVAPEKVKPTPAAQPHTPQVQRTPKHAAQATDAYTVVSGDTLAKIAAKSGSSWQKIFQENGGVIGSNPNLIFPGQHLNI